MTRIPETSVVVLKKMISVISSSLPALLPSSTTAIRQTLSLFALFGEYHRTREKWQLGDKLFEIATRAVSNDRTKRQQSIRHFTKEWKGEAVRYAKL